MPEGESVIRISALLLGPGRGVTNGVEGTLVCSNTLQTGDTTDQNKIEHKIRRPSTWARRGGFQRHRTFALSFYFDIGAAESIIFRIEISAEKVSGVDLKGSAMVEVTPLFD